jgi:hypothetical protein
MAVRTLTVYCQCDRCKETFEADATITGGVLHLDYHPHITP